MAEYPGYDAFCRYCGRPIIFIRTTNGKLMPCDAEPVPYWLSHDRRGVMVYQRNGTYARALLDGLPSLRSGYGYRPHWPGCSGQRKRAPEAGAERETPARRQLRERIEKEREAEAARKAKKEKKRAEEKLRREAEERQCRLF